MSQSEITHISDTALWVAAYRAMETDRSDSLFKDPLAKVLAGDLGFRIVKKMPGGTANAWVLVVRTKIIDDFILNAVEKKGVDLVLNLAAGLDTRPYRLALPPSLHWIEVDFPKLIDYKEARIGDEKPFCHLQRIKMDLSDRAARVGLFYKLNREFKNILVLTEGFLVYLNSFDVESLAKDISEQKNFKLWIQDHYSALSIKMINKRWKRQMKKTPFQFTPPDWIDFFKRHGWKVVENRWTIPESVKLNRKMPYFWFYRFMTIFASRSRMKKMRELSGFALFERTT